MRQSKIEKPKIGASHAKKMKYIRGNILDGSMKSFDDIFIFLPKSVFSNALGMNYVTLCNHIGDKSGFRVYDVKRIAMLFRVPPQKIFNLLTADLNPNVTPPKKVQGPKTVVTKVQGSNKGD